MAFARAALIAELEQATEGSRELDADIGSLLFEWLIDDTDEGLFFIVSADGQGCEHVYPVPAYTTSLNAALSLVPDGWFIELKWGKPIISDREYCHCLLRHDANSVDRDLEEDEPFEVRALNARTPYLALCIAALRARQAMEPNGKGDRFFTAEPK